MGLEALNAFDGRLYVSEVGKGLYVKRHKLVTMHSKRRAP